MLGVVESETDNAVPVSNCPLFSRRSIANWEALKQYSYNINRKMEDMFFRDCDVGYGKENMQGCFYFRLNEDFTGILMHRSVVPLLKDYVYVAIQTIASVVCLSDNVTVYDQIAVLRAVFENVLGVKMGQVTDNEIKFERLQLSRAEVRDYLYLMANCSDADSRKLSAVFGWILSLIGVRTTKLHLLMDMIFLF